jgi:hypothetical protein
MLVIVKVAVPGFPTTTSPTFPVPVTDTAGALAATPVRFATAGVTPGVGSVTVRVATLLPTEAGLNTTAIVQLASGTSGTTHLLSVAVNSAALAPSNAVAKIPVAVPPALPTLKVITVLVSPMVAENGAGVGLMVKIGGVTAVVVTVTFLTVVPALHTMVSLFGPAVVALKMKP